MSVKARFSINMLVIVFSLWSKWMAITTKTFPVVEKRGNMEIKKVSSWLAKGHPKRPRGSSLGTAVEPSQISPELHVQKCTEFAAC